MKDFGNDILTTNLDSYDWVTMMDYISVIRELEKDICATVEIVEPNTQEAIIRIRQEDFRKASLFLHKRLNSPVMMLFGEDERKNGKGFVINCVFLGRDLRKWFTLSISVPAEEPRFTSIAKDIYSAHLFEREIFEMFGVEPQGNPDKRRLNLHGEVWPKYLYPLRKDFVLPDILKADDAYIFQHIKGEGVFEVPVGPVHAGIIGPGHFRFSAAGEPIVNLEIRLGFTHRGVEKIFEDKPPIEAVNLSECVSGDSVFAHSLAFSCALEKIAGAKPPQAAFYQRALCLELERMYNHFNDIGGMSVDVGFSFPAQFASVLKERVLKVNDSLCASRYLKGVNCAGGVLKLFERQNLLAALGELEEIMKDCFELKKMLYSSVSFMDRVDDTGVLRKTTAQDLGVIGLAGRASGIAVDLRKVFPGVYEEAAFCPAREEKGDVLARLKVRITEVEESFRLINYFADKLMKAEAVCAFDFSLRDGSAIGAVEGWRGPVLYWVKIKGGFIQRCKIVDASFHNWPGLSFAVLGNIIPDFPLCNKSFDLSYAGNDL